MRPVFLINSRRVVRGWEDSFINEKLSVIFVQALAMAKFYAKPAGAAKSKLIDEQRTGRIQQEKRALAEAETKKYWFTAGRSGPSGSGRTRGRRRGLR
jgi:hypothetical protein